MAGPLIVLYFLATFVAYLIGKKRQAREHRDEAGRNHADDDRAG
jgi:Sec-independent protein secretion pathway component TatC